MAVEVSVFDVTFFNCGHKVEMRDEQMSPEIREQFYKFGCVPQIHCPECGELDERARAEELIRRMELGLGIP